MASFRESIVINVSPEAAFAYLGDPDTASVIDPAVVSYVSDTNPMGVGSVNTVRVRLFRLPFALTTTTHVLEWEPGHRMVIESVRPARPVKGTATHLFEPHPLGTLYTWAMEITPTGVGGGILAPIFARFMRSNALRQQGRFKATMERDEAPLQGKD